MALVVKTQVIRVVSAVKPEKYMTIKRYYLNRLPARTYLPALLMLAGCIAGKVAVGPAPAATGQYDSKYPSVNCSRELEQISRSVKKVYCISSYTTWQFRRESAITGYHLLQGSFKKAAWGIISTNETAFGTATAIGVSETRIALLTCAHIVTTPDTLISYFEPDEENPVTCIRSFSVKEKQEIWVSELSACGPFKVLAADLPGDIAILGKNCEGLVDTLSPFPCRAGRAKDLAWGSFVYIFGYPLGTRMITSGIVSPAPKRPMGEFSVDALLNKGCSGGIIVAMRSGMAGIELVGIVKNVTSDREEILRPAPEAKQNADWLPYKGEIYAGIVDNIQYGLNSMVPVESILAFYLKNRPELVSSGYCLDSFFIPPKPKNK
ncbi:MAG: serine protease [Bacteroidota bacterium]